MRIGASRSHVGRRAATCVLASILMISCGGNDDAPRLPIGPTTPTLPQPAPLAPGRALLSISSRDEECSTKSPIWGFTGPHVFSGAMLSTSGNDWVARTDGRAASDFEIRFRIETGQPIQELVNGTMRGTVVDLLSTLRFPNPDRVVVGGRNGAAEAAFSGGAYTQFGGVVGTVTGTLAYTDNQGGVTTCTTGLMSLYSQP